MTNQRSVKKSLLRRRWSRDHERHIDVQFLKEKGRLPRSDEERRWWCIAKNMEAELRR